MENKVIHEITPLMGKDVLYIADRRKKEFTYPIHNHEVYELNFVEHAAGVRRIVGDSNEVIGEYDLVLITSPNSGRSLSHREWAELAELVDSIYTGFTEKLYSLYRLSEQDYHVSLLTKVRIQPKDIAQLTAHSKESVASTRSRLYQESRISYSRDCSLICSVL